MELYWCKTDPPNVGDALNTWLWPKLLPRLVESDALGTLFGIGSILDKRLNFSGTKYVVGSGARSYVHGVDKENGLHILAVRGPLTAKAFGLPPRLSTIDPATMLSKFLHNTGRRSGSIGLIPYFASPHEPWRHIAERLDLQLISPHLDVDSFLKALSSCEFVITEAMHGAIMADSLRIPWYPIRANSLASEGTTSSFKWEDWCQSVGVKFAPLDLPPIWNISGTQLGRWRTNLKLAWIEQRIKSVVRGRVRCLSSDRIFHAKTTQLQEIINEFEQTVL